MLDYYILITLQRRNNTSYVAGEKNNKKILDLYNDIEMIKQINFQFPNDNIYTDEDIKRAEAFITYLKSGYNTKLDVYNLLKNELSNRSIENQEKYLNSLLNDNNKDYYNILNYSNRRINKELHKISKYVINYCIKHEIGNIGIGYNVGWKQNTKNLGKKFNRKFQAIPHAKLLHQLKYKAELVGINLITVPELYTSVSSALDYEPIEEIPKNQRFGTRGVSRMDKDKDGNHKLYNARGLFYSKKSNKIIHSDINGAFNIGRLAFPGLFNNVSQKNMLKTPRNIDL